MKVSQLKKCYFQIVWSENAELMKMSIESFKKENVGVKPIRTPEAPFFTYRQLEALLKITPRPRDGYDKVKLAAFISIDGVDKSASITGRYDIGDNEILDPDDRLCDSMGWI